MSAQPIRPIRNDDDLKVALGRLREIFHAEEGTPEAEELEVLGILVHDYERAHHPIPPPDPIEAIKFMMEQKGLRPADLAPMLGSRSRVTEILNGTRPLTLAMIRRLHAGLGIPVEILVGVEPQKKRSA
jgi:HTH-type transcriptional regulator / antitoxin HigA